jgi:hypothetical protein
LALNNYSSQSVTFGRTFYNTILSALSTRAAAALIVAGKVRLSNNPSFNPSADVQISTLAASECDYSGYASGGIAAVVGGPVNLSANTQGVIIPALFQATSADPFVQATAYGWWIDDGTNVIAFERFAGGGSARFGAAGDFLALNVLLPGELLQSAT